MVRVNFYLIVGWLLLGGLVMPLHSSVLAHRQQQNVGYENTPTLILNKHAQAADTPLQYVAQGDRAPLQC